MITGIALVKVQLGRILLSGDSSTLTSQTHPRMVCIRCQLFSDKAVEQLACYAGQDVSDPSGV